MALCFLALAIYAYVKTGDLGITLGLAGLAFVIMLLAWVAQSALRGRQKRYNEAVARYEAALARAADPISDNER